jgi:hypothetical protein
MVPRRTRLLCGVLALTAMAAGAAARADVIYVSSTMPFNLRGTFQGANYNSSTSRGIFFTTGSSGPYTIDLIDTTFWTESGTAGDTYTFNVDVRDVSGGLAGPTLFVTDTVTWQATSNPFIDQSVKLRQAELPNISSFAFQANTPYSVVFYRLMFSGTPSLGVTMMSNSTLGPADTVSYLEGFSNAGFFRNGFTFTGSNSISLGQVVAVPEPSAWALAGLGSVGLAAVGRRTLRRRLAGTFRGGSGASRSPLHEALPDRGPRIDPGGGRTRARSIVKLAAAGLEPATPGL